MLFKEIPLFLFTTEVSWFDAHNSQIKNMWVLVRNFEKIFTLKEVPILKQDIISCHIFWLNTLKCINKGSLNTLVIRTKTTFLNPKLFTGSHPIVGSRVNPRS